MPFTSPLAEALSADVHERLLRSVRIERTSRPDREQSPSTLGLARLLVTVRHGETGD